MTGLDLCTQAGYELGVVSPGEPMDAAISAQLLGKLNRIIDNWNAEREAIYADQFLTVTLTPSLQPHTIGPTGATWTADRPVSIEGVQVALPSGATMRLWMRDAAWWQALDSPTLTSLAPTDAYYDPTYPNGSLYLWPIPTTAYLVQLQVRVVLSAFALSTTIALPPGYADALILTLAEESAASFSAQIQPRLAMSATQARARIFANNIVVPKLTAPAGIPGLHRAWFDYRVGR